MTPVDAPGRPDGYVFGDRVSAAPARLTALQRFLDPLTTSALARTGVRPGHRCLELGAGDGSIARWLADRVGPTGRVTAVDEDVSQLSPAGNLQVHRHDLRQGLPAGVGEPFHVINARLVLVHLPNRDALLRQLVEALVPGGWLVVGEFGRQPLKVLTAGSDRDAALFATVMDAFRAVLAGHGLDLTWVGRIHRTMVEAGLEAVTTTEYAESWRGGEPGCQLHLAAVDQVHDRLLAHGLTDAELDRFRRLLADPAFTTRSYQFVCVRGRRAA